MPDNWMIRGTEFVNCNCAFGCPCQVNAPTTHGTCESYSAGFVEEGYFNETRLDGFNWVNIFEWPGEIADGNGTQRAIIDVRADVDQREALRKILHGESTAPGSTHFYVFNSTMSEVLDPLYESIDLAINVDARRASLKVAGLIEGAGSPIIDPFNGEEFRAGLKNPGGFEFKFAEYGMGSGKVTAGVEVDLSESHAHFCKLHMNQDGVIA